VQTPAVTDVVHMALGSYHTVAVLSNGTVVAWGRNQKGQVTGDGTTTTSPVGPTVVQGITNVKKAAASYYTTCLLLNDGTVKCAGQDSYAELGNGDPKSDSKTFVDVVGITDAVDISAGHHHFCVVLSDATMKCWGRNNQRQLGDNTNTDSTEPVICRDVTDAVSVRLGAETTCYLTQEGTIFCWGDCQAHRCGNGNENDKYYKQSSGQVKIDSSNYLTNVRDFDYAYGSGCAIQTDDTLRCWGRNYNEEMGDDSTSPNVYAEIPSTLATKGYSTASEKGYGELVTGSGTSFSKDRGCHA
jgi:alpha-tubulin suppressor-like RCC1 family protein